MITGTMPPTLRPACGSDYATVATWSTSAAACLRWAGPRLPFPFAAVDLERLLEIPGGGCSHVLASGTEPPLGFSQHWVAIPGAVHLGRIIVAPALRGHGLGRLLVERSIERAAREPGAQSVTLRVYRDNAAALRLYQSLRFVEEPASSTAEVAFMRAAIACP